MNLNSLLEPIIDLILLNILVFSQNLFIFFISYKRTEP